MDFVMLWRMIDCLNRGEALDMDVYDAAAWSVVTPVSELCAIGQCTRALPGLHKGLLEKRTEAGGDGEPVGQIWEIKKLGNWEISQSFNFPIQPISQL